MKKIIAIILSLALLMGCAAAFAENAAEGQNLCFPCTQRAIFRKIMAQSLQFFRSLHRMPLTGQR